MIWPWLVGGGALLLGLLGGAVARIAVECQDTGESFGEVLARVFQQGSR
jgi:hypothetical protein